MSFLEGSCIATITVVNNTKASIVLNQTNTYQMDFPGLPLDVNAGCQATFQVFAQQGSDFPGDDNGSIACTLMGSGCAAANIAWQGQGVTSNEGPMQTLTWQLQPGANAIEPVTGVLVNTGGNMSVLEKLTGVAAQLCSPKGVDGMAACSAFDGADEIAAAVGVAIAPLLVAMGIDLVVTGSESNIGLDGANIITFQPTS